jgi:hypothetical protein
MEPPTLHKVPAPPPANVEPTPARAVAMEIHLTVVTALETARSDNARLERLNSTLQAELFKYRRLSEEDKSEVIELRSRLDAANQGMFAAKLEKMEMERQRIEFEQALANRLQAELEAARQVEEAKKVTPRTWWQRVFG